MRIGFGYDLHPLVSGRSLILGGVEIPFEKGLDGHSDADALCHAVGDALLGAAALGDIGEHFPDSSPRYKNVSSLILLHRIGEMIREAGYAVVNIDTTIILQTPRLGPNKQLMREKLAGALELEVNRISVKAKTNEGFDSTGREETIAVHAVALISDI